MVGPLPKSNVITTAIIDMLRRKECANINQDVVAIQEQFVWFGLVDGTRNRQISKYLLERGIFEISRHSAALAVAQSRDPQTYRLSAKVAFCKVCDRANVQSYQCINVKFIIAVEALAAFSCSTDLEEVAIGNSLKRHRVLGLARSLHLKTQDA